MTKGFRNEIWKLFTLKDCNTNYEEIYVSNYGRVKRKKPNQTEFKLTKFIHANEFRMFFFYRNSGKPTSYYVHRAVAILFIENPENKTFVIHKDHDLKNNEFTNLAWLNRSELVKHQLTNPKRIAKLGSNAKLNEGRVKIIKRKIFDPNRKTRMKIIAKEFGISTMQLYRIKSGENWGHVTDF